MIPPGTVAAQPPGWQQARRCGGRVGGSKQEGRLDGDARVESGLRCNCGWALGARWGAGRGRQAAAGEALQEPTTTMVAAIIKTQLHSSHAHTARPHLPGASNVQDPGPRHILEPRHQELRKARVQPRQQAVLNHPAKQGARFGLRQLRLQLWRRPRLRCAAGPRVQLRAEACKYIAGTRHSE